MLTPDLINTGFEIAGAIFNSMNVIELLKDRRTKGTFWPAWIAYGAWGLWDLVIRLSSARHVVRRKRGFRASRRPVSYGWGMRHDFNRRQKVTA